jgi:hypothetical protein
VSSPHPLRYAGQPPPPRYENLRGDPLLEVLCGNFRGPPGPARTMMWRVSRRYSSMVGDGILRGLV